MDEADQDIGDGSTLRTADQLGRIRREDAAPDLHSVQAECLMAPVTMPQLERLRFSSCWSGVASPANGGRRR